MATIDILEVPHAYELTSPISGSSHPVLNLASFHQLFEKEGNNVLEIHDCGHLSMVEHPQKVVTLISQIVKKYKELE